MLHSPSTGTTPARQHKLSLQDIIDKLEDLNKQYESTAGHSIDIALEAGEFLFVEKAMVKSQGGKFDADWIDAHHSYSYRRAREFMQAYKAYKHDWILFEDARKNVGSLNELLLALRK